MSRIGAEAELLLISEAVAHLEAGMYGNFNRAEAVIEARKHFPGASIGFGPQKEHAARIIDRAILKSELSVFVLPDAIEGEARGAPLQVASDALRKMIRTRGGLPDHAVQPFVKDLSKSALYLRREEFEAWYQKAKKKRNWPSQRSSCKPRMGRPSKQTELLDSIKAIANGGRWSAEQNFIADLVRLLKSKGVTASRQTVERTVELLYRETGDLRYYSADPRKKPDHSVWGSFEDLAERRRRAHLKNDQKS
ncbi:hypothetical protein [Bradyrhizobium japonicum]|uniref:hypothetical protein n=1 Tax=Bradyrhizobium japonicum TaxID=375 RepID=UPI003399B0D3